MIAEGLIRLFATVNRHRRLLNKQTVKARASAGFGDYCPNYDSFYQPELIIFET